jgi:hypothetical protein
MVRRPYAPMNNGRKATKAQNLEVVSSGNVDFGDITKSALPAIY